MAQYLISYDLHNRRQYQDLWDALSRMQAIKLHASVWVGNFVGPAETLRDILMQTVDDDDSVTVIELKPGCDWASVRATTPATDWLIANLGGQRVA